MFPCGLSPWVRLCAAAATAQQPSTHALIRALATTAPQQQRDDIYDVVIVGSGMVGSALAALLGNNELTRGLRVAILDQQPQSLEVKLPPVPELRVSTVTPSSIACLKKAGAWGEIRPHAAMFAHMQVWDASGSGCIRWDARDLGHGHMGAVAENSLLTSALLAAARRSAPESTLSMVWPASVVAMGLPGQRPQPPARPAAGSQASAAPAPSSPASSAPSSASSASASSSPSASHGPASASSREGPSSPSSSSSSSSSSGLAWLQLQDGRRLHARLVVAADGAASKVRALAGLRASDWSYNQRALVATVRTSAPEDRTAWQRFLPSGPFALLPVRGGHHNIVWTTTPDAAKALESLGPQEFAAAANKALHDPLSPTPGQQLPFPPLDPLPHLERLLAGLVPEQQRPRPPPRVEAWVGSQPRSFPLHLKKAGRYVLPRLALIGDAAHAVHPLAGQGVNLGLGDAEALAKAVAVACECGADVGSALILQEHYEKPRKAANQSMIAALDAVKTSFALQAAPLALARNVGLSLINATSPVKNGIMRYAMGLN